MYCIHCGREIPPEAQFCRYCGKKVCQTKQEAPAKPASAHCSGKPGTKGKAGKERGIRRFFKVLWRTLLGFVIFCLFMGAVILVGDKVDEKKAREREALLAATRLTQETLSPEEEALAERLPGVYKEYWELDVFQNRGMGSSSTMKGNVAVTLIFAEDAESSWSQQEMDAFLGEVTEDAAELTVLAAQWGTELNMTISSSKCTLDYPLEPEMAYGSLGQILHSAGHRSYEPADALREATGADAVPVVVAFNKEGRSYAIWDADEAKVEACYLFGGSQAFKHELLHLFGAVDYYYHDLMAAAVKDMMEESIMLDSGNGHVDSFTAYLVGWTDKLDGVSSMMATAFNYIGDEEMQEAHAENMYTGMGTQTFEDGTVYSGYLSVGVPDGFGEMQFYNGDRYTGEFKNGARTGYGTYCWQNGDIYEGYFRNGQLHGEGTFTWADGSTRSGVWEEGSFVG